MTGGGRGSTPPRSHARRAQGLTAAAVSQHVLQKTTPGAGILPPQSSTQIIDWRLRPPAAEACHHPFQGRQLGQWSATRYPDAPCERRYTHGKTHSLRCSHVIEVRNWHPHEPMMAYRQPGHILLPGRRVLQDFAPVRDSEDSHAGRFDPQEGAGKTGV